MRRELFAFVFVFAAGSSGCQCEVSVGGASKKAEKGIKAELDKITGLDVAVECPDLKKDKVGHCTVTADKQSFLVEATIDKDGMDWKTDGVGFGPKVVADIRGTYEKRYGWKFDSLSCEPIIVAGKEPPRACVGKVSDVEIPFAVEIVNNKSKYKPTAGVVFANLAQDFAQKRIKEQHKVDVKVACKTAVIPSVPGQTFDCSATDPKGASRTVRFKITSKNGDASFALLPEAAPKTP